MVSVLSYNICYGKRLSDITNWITSLPNSFQILCFQEFPYASIKQFLKSFRKEPYGYSFVPSINIHKKSYGQLTLFDKTKCNRTRRYIINLGKSKTEAFISRNIGVRNTLVTDLHDGKRSLTVANTHLTALNLNSKRRSQLNHIMDVLKTNESDTKAQIIVGDLNYSSLIRQSKLFDLMNSYGFANAFRLKTHKILILQHQLDYVFYKNCIIEDFKVSKIRFSDHLPVTFSLLLK